MHCKILATLSVCGCLALAADQSAAIKSDAQLHAMQDELARSKTLEISNLDKPYFIQYSSSDEDQFSVTASLGGIVSSNRVRLRIPRVQVRVGDYKFDNTNSIYSGFGRAGLFPTDDDYGAMRHTLWLVTDGMYKSSADQITRKRTALREIAEPDNTPDLAPAKPIQFLGTPQSLNIDRAAWEQIIRRLSNVFAAHSDVLASSVALHADASTFRVVNTEGTVVRMPQDVTYLEIRASALAKDGTRVRNHQTFTVSQPSELPTEAQLTKSVEALAAETDALAKAPVAEEYSGPVLFENEAAAQMIAQVLADTSRLQRKPVAPPGSNNAGLQTVDNVWATRIGSKVVPEWLSMVDDPGQEKFGGAVLAGHYAFDDEGVPGERVTLIDKGTLKSFLFSREPVRKFNASNGHGRLPGNFGTQQPVIGNLFVQAENAQPEGQMKAKLIEKVKAAGLKYGMAIRRMDFPSTANYQELQGIARQLQKSGYARTLTEPLLAYRVYVDGREELVRDLRFKEFSAKDLRDIDSASDQPYVLNYINTGSGFNLADTGGDSTTSTVVCPSLLFDSIDLTHADDEPGKLPIVPPPALIAQQ